jgi:hypothetical protein
VLHCVFANAATKTRQGGGGVISETETFQPAVNESILLKWDIIIFDVGLFYQLWNIPNCIAVELDGGYGRFMWCISHTFALTTFMIVAICCRRPQPHLLYPMLIQQSMYGVGLLILSLAGLPKVLPLFVGSATWTTELFVAIFVYIFGATINFFLLYVAWHWYWHVEREHNDKKNAKQNQQQTQTLLKTSYTSDKMMLNV